MRRNLGDLGTFGKWSLGLTYAGLASAAGGMAIELANEYEKIIQVEFMPVDNPVAEQMVQGGLGTMAVMGASTLLCLAYENFKRRPSTSASETDPYNSLLP
ncbi:MAG TPA: hypothetical protein VK983_02610 [Candidatus Limnocylindrales bacterium]|nr:hypothetical protein [Candidatus Limnocylindrales bacterium]